MDIDQPDDVPLLGQLITAERDDGSLLYMLVLMELPGEGLLLFWPFEEATMYVTDPRAVQWLRDRATLSSMSLQELLQWVQSQPREDEEKYRSHVPPRFLWDQLVGQFEEEGYEEEDEQGGQGWEDGDDGEGGAVDPPAKKPRGRPKATNEELVRKLSEAQQIIRNMHAYKRRKNAKRQTDSEQGRKVRLIEEAIELGGVIGVSSRGLRTVSCSGGMAAQLIQTEGRVSSEKLPLVIASALMLIFGPLPDTLLNEVRI
jgi:hypothetical protein